MVSVTINKIMSQEPSPTLSVTSKLTFVISFEMLPCQFLFLVTVKHKDSKILTTEYAGIRNVTGRK